MRKKITFLRTLLIAAGLCMGSSSVWAQTTTKTSALTKSVVVCGNKHSADGETTIDITNLKVNKYGNSYSEAQMMFTLDETFDASKVQSATIKFYVISRTSNTGRYLKLYSLDDEKFNIPAGTAWETSTEDAKIYNSGGNNASSFGLGNSTELASTASSNLTQGAYNSFDITDFVKGLTTKTGGDAVYLGMLGTSAIDVFIGGIGYSNPAYLEITYNNATKYTYSLTAVDSEGNTLTSLDSGTYFEGEDAPTISWNKCINVGGVYYYTDETTFTETVSGNTAKEVTYIADPSIVYFEEGESITHDKTAGSNYSGGYCSDYRSAGKYNSTTIAQTGAYKLDMYVAEGYDRNRSFGVLTKDGDVYTPLAYITKPGSAGLFSTSNFFVEAGTTLYTGYTANTLGLDYLIIRKVADVIDINHEFVGAFDFTTEANAVHSSDYTLKKGETKVFTFQNHGSTFGNNWRIEVKEGEIWKSNLCADSWDYTAGAKANVTAYTESKDGGITKIALDWNDYEADMPNACVVATLTYGTDGTLAIRTTSTGAASSYIYYVDQDVTGLTDDLTINLSVCKSWLEILSVEQTVVAATIGTPGYATFSSTYALDLDNISGGEAYVVTSAANGYIHLEEATGVVPANTGLILKKVGGGEVTIPVSASAGTAPTTNYLVAVTADDTNVPTGSYVLAADGDVAGFYLIDETPATLNAGKAYLSSEIGSGNAKLRIDVADDATAIMNVNAVPAIENSVFYNVAGQRVNAAYKGVVIKDGKKYLRK